MMPPSESEHQTIGVDVIATFRSLLTNEPDLATAIAAIKTLMLVLEKCKIGTLQELVAKLNKATEEMKTKVDCSSVSVASGGELFLRFITLASEDLEKDRDVEHAREIMLKRGNHFLSKLMQSRSKVVKLAEPFLNKVSNVLVHSRSKCAMGAISAVHRTNPTLHVYVTETASDKSGHAMKEYLDSLGVSNTLILDSSIAYIMGKVDCVLLGAEGVVETGGILNKIGSFTISLCAKELKKPVYVLCESFKFVRLYPLGQDDLPNEFKYFASTLEKSENLAAEHPLIDYTPPSYITLLFTDLGILTPSAVCDELLKLYL